jgi:hypothetical protein
MGVISTISVTSTPLLCRARMALSRPPPGTFHEDLHLAQAQFMRFACCLFSAQLAGIRCVLLASAETVLAGGGPADHFTLVVGEADDQVVERGTGCGPDRRPPPPRSSSSSYRRRRRPCLLALPYLVELGSVVRSSARTGNVNYFVAFFLLATVFRLPLRVRLLVRVRCPRTGRPAR